MFCDLVGSTALSTRFDPEDLRELIGDYHRAVADTVGRFDGFVAKYMGDGVLIYFGYPQAHEDDAERAVRAGLAVIEAVARLTGSVTMQVRIGIATGLAVVGDLIGVGRRAGAWGRRRDPEPRRPRAGARRSRTRSSSPKRRAGRSAGCSISPISARRRLPALPSRNRRGGSLGESGTLSRFEALRSGETPLVGRDEEIELLLRRWQQAKSGEGRVVLISGEPGIGKSRLTAALSEQHRNRAPYPPALFLFAAPPGQRALSLHRAARTRRRTYPRRYGRRQARQIAGTARAGLAG